MKEERFAEFKKDWDGSGWSTGQYLKEEVSKEKVGSQEEEEESRQVHWEAKREVAKDEAYS